MLQVKVIPARVSAFIRLSQTKEYHRRMMETDIFPCAEKGQLVMTGVGFRHAALDAVDKTGLPVILFMELFIAAVDGETITRLIQYIGENAPRSEHSYFTMIGMGSVQIFQHIDILIIDGQVRTDERIRMTREDLVVARIGYFVEILHVDLIVISPVTQNATFFCQCIPEERKELSPAEIHGGIPVQFLREGSFFYIFLFGFL